MNSLAWRLRRTAARRYPFLSYRDRPRFFRWSPEEILEGIVDTRAGIRVRVTGDRSTTASSSGVTTSPTTRRSITGSSDRRRPCSMWVSISDGLQSVARWVGPRGFVHAFEPVPFIHHSRTLSCSTTALREGVAPGAARGRTTIRTRAGLRMDTRQSRHRDERTWLPPMGPR